jgi:hydroxyacylglutathione hydrolase
MRIQQFRYSADNLAYLIYTEHEAMAVDGGAVAGIRDFLASRGLRLKFATHTHSHPDHTAGTPELLAASRARLLTRRELVDAGEVTLDGGRIEVLQTPGHTADSVSFHLDGILITGDTLFNGTVGNCFTGDLRTFYDSIRHLMSFPENTRVYAGHDYVDYAMKFARLVEPENPDIDGYLAAYDADHVTSTLADELRVNPYLRFNDAAMIAILKDRGLPVETEYQRWEALMSLE